MTVASGKIATLWKRISFGQQISDLDRSTVKDGMCCDDSTLQWCAVGSIGNWPMVANETENVAVRPKNRCVIGITKAGCARCYLCKHALGVHRRA